MSLRLKDPESSLKVSLSGNTEHENRGILVESDSIKRSSMLITFFVSLSRVLSIFVARNIVHNFKIPKVQKNSARCHILRRGHSEIQVDRLSSLSRQCGAQIFN